MEQKQSLGDILRKVRTLRQGLAATIEVNHEGWEEHKGSYHRDGPIMHPGYTSKDPDTETREAARAQLASLKDDIGQLPIVRYAATRSLGEKTERNIGYSVRIFLHQHPAEIAATGIVLAGAASGLGYMLSQYLSR